MSTHLWTPGSAGPLDELVSRVAGIVAAFASERGLEQAEVRFAARSIVVPPSLQKRASAAIDRILGDESELRDLWEEGSEGAAWRAAVEDLRRRIFA